MEIDIREAVESDVAWIGGFSARLGRPARSSLRWTEYFVACKADEKIGCAAVLSFGAGGYLYGLVVAPRYRRQGVGSRLTEARLERVRAHGGRMAVVLAMFWNVRFFRGLGFHTVARSTLPESVLGLPDFQAETYRRSAVLVKALD